MTKKLEKMIRDKEKYENKIIEAEQNIRTYRAEIKNLTVKIKVQKQADILSLLSAHGVDYDRLKEILETDNEPNTNVSEKDFESEIDEDLSENDNDLILE